MPYVEQGLCPFEGCGYRDWTALTSVAAVGNPSGTWEGDQKASDFKPVFTIKPGEVVTAMTGVVVVTAPGRGRITNETRTESIDLQFPKRPGTPVTLAAGDEVFLLSYHGEGVFTAWVHGVLFTFRQFTDGVVVAQPQSVWWVQVRNARGEIGWTTEAREFTNVDALGGPPESSSMFVYQFGERPWTELKPGVHIKPLVGETGTFTLAELEPGAETFVHHHTQEQLNVGLSGNNEISRAGHTSGLGAGVATVTPPDAEHFIRNAGAGNATLLEFQPIRRFDLLPPRPAAAYPVAPQAVSMTPAQLKSIDIGSNALWVSAPNGVRTKTLAGQHSAFSVIDIPAAVTQAVNLRPQPVANEQFFYVLNGTVRIDVAGRDKDELQPYAGTAFLLPRTSTPAYLRVTSKGGARLLRFDVR